ncbi:hypothetical protein DL93DRAFT_415355 [Clavulina sp. PMI_390]|nr:hypothetical protein DL93DRAFT_415355 [Clavulina sp. PMI_390]
MVPWHEEPNWVVSRHILAINALMICAILANLHLRSHLLDSIPSDEIIPASNISLHGIQRAQQRYSQQHAAANVYYHSVVHDPLGRSAHSGVAKFFLDDAENGMSSSSTMVSSLSSHRLPNFSDGGMGRK